MLLNLLVAKNLSDVSMKEAMRILVPEDVAYIK